MKEKTLTFIRHPLFSGSAIMIVGSNLVAGLNYIYHFLMGRLLGAAAYGELVSLFSLLGLLGMLPMALNFVVIKFVSSATDKSETYSLIVYLQKKILWGTGIIIILSFLLAHWAKGILHLSSEVNFILIGFIFAASLIVFINRAVLQGSLRFYSYVLSSLSDNIFKLVGGVLFVFLGYSVFGALMALIIGSIVSIALSFFLIRDFFIGHILRLPAIKSLFIYSLPVFAHQLAITSFISTDLLFVKHFFDPVTAGNYSATSTIAKIIFFAASPIMSVMFPLISKRVSNGQSYKNIFLVSVLMTLFVTISGAIFFTFFAPLAVWILFGKDFGSASVYLPLFSIFMILLSLNNLVIGFYLSLNKTKISILPLGVAVLQILLMLLFHNTLFEILFVSVGTSALLSIFLTVYSIYEWNNHFSNRTGLSSTKNNRQGSKKNS